MDPTMGRPDGSTRHSLRRQAGRSRRETHRPGNMHHHALEDFRRRFFVSTIPAVPILLLSPPVRTPFGILIMLTDSNYLLLALATVVYRYGCWPLLVGIVSELRTRMPGMTTLIAIAITVAYVYGSAVVLSVSSAARGVRCMMLTGDNRDVAEWVAREFDLDEFFAGAFSHERAAKIREVQERYQVTMVDDGINDAPAPVQADVGIAIGGGDRCGRGERRDRAREERPRDAARSSGSRRRSTGGCLKTSSGRPATTSLPSCLPPACSRTVIVAINARLLRI